jgi:hypothetical protein
MSAHTQPPFYRVHTFISRCDRKGLGVDSGDGEWLVLCGECGIRSPIVVPSSEYAFTALFVSDSFLGSVAIAAST